MMHSVARSPILAFAFLLAVGTAQGQGLPNPPGSGGIFWAATNNDVGAINSILSETPSLAESADGDLRTAIHYAAAHNACDAIRVLFAAGTGLDRRTRENVTAIQWALEYHQYDAFKLLLSLGANLDIRRNDGHDVEPGGRDFGLSKYSILAQALTTSSPEEFVANLIDRGADPNEVTSAGQYSPLMLCAIHGGSSSIVSKLIKHGALVNERSTVGKTALSYAVEAGNADIARILLVNGAYAANQPGDNDAAGGQAYALAAVRGGSLECLRLVVCFGAPLSVTDRQGRDLLEVALNLGRSDLSGPLNDLKAKASLGYTSAHFAALYGHAEALPILKDRGFAVDLPDADGDSPLMVAASVGNLAACDALIKLGADLGHRNAAGETCLHKAATNGADSVVALLLAAGASPAVKDNGGQTAHSIAVREHNELLAKMLATATPVESSSAGLKKAIESGDEAKALSIIDADAGMISTRYGKAWTPLHLAAYYGRAKVVKALASKGASLDARSETGWTPLMVAVQQKNDAVVKALLQLKVDPNQRANNGRTALHVAAQENCAACVSLLIHAGAKASIKDSGGFTALAIAEKLGNGAAAAALRAKT
jgi:ankyrin